MGQSRPLFVLFSVFSCYNFNTNWKKRRWCAWDLNPGSQDGRRRRNHGAMAATQGQIVKSKKFETFTFKSKLGKTNPICWWSFIKQNALLQVYWAISVQWTLISGTLKYIKISLTMTDAISQSTKFVFVRWLSFYLQARDEILQSARAICILYFPK